MKKVLEPSQGYSEEIRTTSQTPQMIHMERRRALEVDLQTNLTLHQTRLVPLHVTLATSISIWLTNLNCTWIISMVLSSPND